MPCMCRWFERVLTLEGMGTDMLYRSIGEISRRSSRASDEPCRLTGGSRLRPFSRKALTSLLWSWSSSSTSNTVKIDLSVTSEITLG